MDRLDSPRRRAPWHLWVVGIFALLWSCGGAVDYYFTQTENEAYLSNFTEAQLDFFLSIPAWVVAFWAIAVWGGVLGAILLLAKRKAAVWVFLASLVGLIITAFHNYVLADGLSVMGDAFSLGFTAAIFLLSLGFFFYARAMARRGVLV
ncbi:MAG: hypothetical protein P8080_10445 [Gammaproteobacteria bacterium]